MSSDYKFHGWLGKDKHAVEGKMQWEGYEPKTWQETDIDIKITHCGICGSDLHTLRSGWGPTIYPCCVGHEIVGTAVRVGKEVKKNIKVGDRVGVGAQSDSCLKPDCYECASGLENHCPRQIGTYSDKYPDGSIAYGGYADYCRAPSHFVIPIPSSLPSSHAAPMLCGGITVFAPLQTHSAGPGKRVGIVGIGGLGHFGLLYAAALGCSEITAISRSSAKKADAMKMGATTYIATDEEPDWTTRYARSLDLIVCTVSSARMPLEGYLELLRTKGAFVQVGAPEEQMPGFAAFALIMKGATVGGSSIGSPREIEEMLQLSAEKGVKPWIQTRPMKEANQAVVDMDAGKARYRYCLVNEAHAES